jgi:lipopolysaccharide export system protein LptC
MESGDDDKKGLSNSWAVREVDHLFTRIGYYTRFVSFGKWVLVLFALLLLACLIAWPLVEKDQSGIRVAFTDSKTAQANTAASTAASPVMDSPEYRGNGDKGQRYKINGTRGTQVTPTLVVVDQVEGQLLMANNSWMSLTADRGEYHQDIQILQLFGNVTLIDDRGYTFVTPHATVNTQTMDAHGEDPVSGTGPLGNLLASGFQIKDNGANITFVRGPSDPVHVHIDRSQKQ